MSIINRNVFQKISYDLITAMFVGFKNKKNMHIFDSEAIIMNACIVSDCTVNES